MTTATKNYYANFENKVVCFDCADTTLKSAIESRLDGINFQGMSDLYQILTGDEIAEYRSCALLCGCN